MIAIEDLPQEKLPMLEAYMRKKLDGTFVRCVCGEMIETTVPTEFSPIYVQKNGDLQLRIVGCKFHIDGRYLDTRIRVRS